MPERLLRHYRLRLRRTLRRIARSTGTSQQIALGAAIGMLVGMTPTIGLQMLIAVAIATLLRANRLAAALPVWISNPLTMAPLYSFNYWVGRMLAGGPGLAEFRATFKQAIDEGEATGVIEPLLLALKRLAQLGLEIQLPLWTGCLIVGMVAATPTYFLVRRAVDRFRRALQKRRHERAERVEALWAQEGALSPPAEPSSGRLPRLIEDAPTPEDIETQHASPPSDE